jgi:SAM-dependent methyltransferase
MDQNKADEIRTAQESLDRAAPETFRKPFGRHWGSTYWTKWATVTHAVHQLGVPDEGHVLDVGVGSGWTSLFLAEAGYQVLGVTLAPAAVEIARQRAERWSSTTAFEVGDMEELDTGERFDLALIFDALHHSKRQALVIERLAAALKPGGWVLFGEPSALHGISPSARRVQDQAGWVERGISVRALKRDCARAGLGEFRRFFEGTSPYESRTTGFGWQLVRVVAANVAFAPQSSIWLAARKPAGI